MMATQSRVQAESRKRGRPPRFDRDTALHQAMLLFWRHGYESTSIQDLTTAMRISPPSLYAAFGDKKQLFFEAVQRYLSGPVTSQSIIQDAPTARVAATNLLRAAAEGFTGSNTPAGCLLASAAISCSAESTDVQVALRQIRREVEKQLRIKIQKDNTKHGPFPAVDAVATAGFIVGLIQGLSTLARDGASRKALLAIVETAMNAWPSDL